MADVSDVRVPRPSRREQAIVETEAEIAFVQPLRRGRVLLVVPEHGERLYTQTPLDVLYAASWLRTVGLEVAVWDRRVQSDVPDGPFDVIALSTATSDRAQCYPLDLSYCVVAVHELRHHFPTSRLVVYGPHATHLPQDTSTVLGADVVVRGELEAAAVHGILACLEDGTPEPVLPDPSLPPVRVPFEQLPCPAYDLAPMRMYKGEVVRRGAVESGATGIVLAYRGCSYQCSFCHLPFGTRLRSREVARVRAELNGMEALGIRDLFFLDYVFGLDRDAYYQLCTDLVPRSMSWIAQSRPEIVLRADLDLWKRAGGGGIWLGMESLEVAAAGVRKPVGRHLVESAMTRLYESGITPLLFILIGLPNETSDSLLRLVEWLQFTQAPFIVNQLVLRPGTELYDKLAPKLNGGCPPSTWDEVGTVTAAYRRELGVDLEGTERRLEGLDNHLGNLMASQAPTTETFA